MESVSKSCSCTRGFTLVELIIIVTIIAILSVIGITVFSSVQKNARDAKRKADINAIAKALEVKQVNDGDYAGLSVRDFANGIIPQNSFPGQPYCIGGSSTSTPPNPPSVWGSPTGPAGNTCSPNPPYSQINSDGSYMLDGGLNISWRTCAVLENPPNTIYCLTNQQ